MVLVESTQLNQYYIEDCVDTMNNRIPDNSINLILTSPPYDDMRNYSNNYSFDFETIAKLLAQKLVKGGIIVWVVGDASIKGSETGTSFKQALFFKNECKLRLHDTMLFMKNTTSFPAKHKGKRYTQIFEYMFVFSKGNPVVGNLIFDKPNRWAGTTNFGLTPPLLPAIPVPKNQLVGPAGLHDRAGNDPTGRAIFSHDTP